MALTVAEELLYTTVKLASSINGAPNSTGTGFFMGFPIEEERNVVVLITNKHVVAGATEVTAVCHLANGDAPSGRHVPCTVPVRPEFVVDHPAADIDLCGILFGPTLNQANAAGTPLFYRTADPNIIPQEEDWQYFDAIEDVTMIGCPRGISDEANNLPIVRRGITASSLSKMYNGKREFMVDMACFPGSSGSPIFLYNRDGYLDRKGKVYMMGATRLLLVGILYSGPLVTNNGQLVLGKAPQVMVQSMMHLGNAVRSTAILDIEAEIKRRLGLSAR